MNYYIRAVGSGYNGRYHFRPFHRGGWCLRGDGSNDYLTPGIGYPMHADTPEALLELIQKYRPECKLTKVNYED